MDDNRILTLANNDRIPMLRPNVTLHFEVEDLRNASPATVSRAGIIYISEADLGWRPYVATFLACRPHDLANLRVAFDTYTDSMLTFVRRECKSKMAISEISLISSLCVTLESLTQGLVKPPSQPALERYFLYSLMWSVAGVLEADDRARVDAHLHTLTENLPAASYPDTCFEFAVSASGSHEWTHWGKAIPQWRFHGNDIAREFASLSVPTIDSVRLEYNIGNSLNMLRPVLLVGSSGTAKTASILQVQDRNKTH
jgi:dynein heavy chain|tara:strand:- start:7653 stop:8420 length:768 start_codon:yes stop_codon:yes gene_type:complete